MSREVRALVFNRSCIASVSLHFLFGKRLHSHYLWHCFPDPHWCKLFLSLGPGLTYFTVAFVSEPVPSAVGSEFEFSS